jgi:hypothetical protein
VGLFKKADVTVTEVVTNQRGVVLDKDQVFNKDRETIKHKSDRTLGAFYDAGEPIIMWGLYMVMRQRGLKEKAPSKGPPIVNGP